MLLLDAIITFYTKSNSPSGHSLSYDPETVGIHLRPTINFGNDYLCSSELRAGKEIKKILRGGYYRLLIELLTVEDEAYALVKDFIKKGNSIKLQVGSKVMGEGIILDFIYK